MRTIERGGHDRQCVVPKPPARLRRPPFQPGRPGLGTEATFVARTHHLDRAHMMQTFRWAHDHLGAGFVEIYENCNVFNDGAFDKIAGREARAQMLIPAGARPARAVRR